MGKAGSCIRLHVKILSLLSLAAGLSRWPNVIVILSTVLLPCSPSRGSCVNIRFDTWCSSTSANGS